MFPSRVKILLSSTITSIYKSPLGPPLEPLSPLPWTQICWPEAIPAGILTSIVFLVVVYPRPLQTWHLFLIILPVPLHLGHVLCDCICPKIVCWTLLTVPVPRQSGHVSISEGESAPVPLQWGQFSSRFKSKSMFLPLIASIKEIFTLFKVSAPLTGPLLWRDLREPPPKKEPKISPKSISPKSPNPPLPPKPAWGSKAA